MPSELQFEIFSVYPNDAMKPNVLTEYKFKFGSIAGCVGNEINRKKKPGINEDGGMVIVTETKILSLMIDGHYSRDTTDILLNVFKQNIEENTQLINVQVEDYNFLKTCNWYTRRVLEELQKQDSEGEASFMISLIDLQSNRLLLYSVGDVMLFIADPMRGWAPYYQLGQRHYYEWINKIGIAGYHFDSIEYNPTMSIIITTDGLIDDPVINIDEIEKIFQVIKNPAEISKAGTLVNYALDELDFDDNITTIYINPTD
ncbi:MAG: hypothetical protein HeimC2_14100 [Candidatus Heimdallarchaeota archaeon LC_2]|nr:MAG: hypothetical protein HeimC2_14100 [Candidatus Heimdallarchaeota archaeon LC_2]